MCPIAQYKKVSLLQKTASGVKNFVESKGFGAWFMKLFQLVSSRDSCQATQAIEPSASGVTVDDPDRSISPKPSKSKGKGKMKKNDLKSAIQSFNKLVENDPTKDFIDF